MVYIMLEKRILRSIKELFLFWVWVCWFGWVMCWSVEIDVDIVCVCVENDVCVFVFDVLLCV